MKRHLSFAGWFVLIIIILSSALYAGMQGAPFHVLSTSGRSLWQIDTNGREVSSAYSPTSGEGVMHGFVTGSGASSYTVTFKNSQGTAVAMPDTNYVIMLEPEDVTETLSAVTTVQTKTTSGFTFVTSAAIDSDTTMRWRALRF